MRIDNLSPKQKEAIEIFANGDDEADEDTFHVLDKCDGCVPDDCIGDDVLAAIRGKFEKPYWAAIKLAKKHAQDLELELLVDADYDDSTRLAILDYNRPYVYLRDEHKAWNFWFKSTSDLADFIIAASDKIIEAQKNRPDKE